MIKLRHYYTSLRGALQTHAPIASTKELKTRKTARARPMRRMFLTLIVIASVLLVVTKAYRAFSVHADHAILEQLFTPLSYSWYPKNAYIPSVSDFDNAPDICRAVESKFASRMSSNSKFTTSSLQSGYVSSAVKNIQCPSAKNGDSAMIHGETMTKGKYAERLRDGGCAANTGMWKHASLQEQKCYYLLGLQHMEVDKRRNSRGAANGVILDWGAGCSHQMFWAYEHFGYYGFGLDLTKGTDDYAMQHFNHHGNGPVVGFCTGDAADLSYIDDNTFEHIVSIGSVFHLPIDKQCDLVTEHFIRIVKPGGKIWIGWNGNDWSTMTQQKWRLCLDGYTEIEASPNGEISYEIVYEIEALGMTVYSEKTSFSIFITKL